MSPTPENHEQKLEHLIQQTVRGLPARRAPGSLENRVLAELERRAALPWWRKSYAHWPLPARCGFLIGSAAVLKAVLMATVWIMVGFQSAAFTEAFSASFGWLHVSVDFVSSLFEFAAAVLSSVPRFWLYAGGVSLAAMYATLIGVGAFTYRAFHEKRVSL